VVEVRGGGVQSTKAWGVIKSASMYHLRHPRVRSEHPRFNLELRSLRRELRCEGQSLFCLRGDSVAHGGELCGIPRAHLHVVPASLLESFFEPLFLDLQFRGGPVFMAHRLLYHSTLGLRVIKMNLQFRGGPVFEAHRLCITQL